ncbi:MAG: NTP transferase domain-containing protein [Syntrophales bacterium]|jgi:UDP-N-acetylglucosamine diphosphorylase/glucosamine-1-phosphate N-acetyltransferase|nr:NTP transferase domain-containing protein [Syntrophales bacterium]MDY0044801.1 NTP transferase domain-containing protein [Syntrophales bacterium]
MFDSKKNLKRLAAIILAAGKGKRMQSDLAKVLHPLCGKPMLLYPIRAARALGCDKIVVVIGHQAERIKEVLKDSSLIYIHQEEQLGTGHAVMQTEAELKNFGGTVLILCGDVPLLQSSTLQELTAFHYNSRSDVTVLTTIVPNPDGYGRILKDTAGRVKKIVEDRDASEQEKEIAEINTGIYCVQSDFLFEALAAVKADNSQKEYYLTDIVEISDRCGRITRSFLLPDPKEAMGINTPAQLNDANTLLKSRGCK